MRVERPKRLLHPQQQDTYARAVLVQQYNWQVMFLPNLKHIAGYPSTAVEQLTILQVPPRIQQWRCGVLRAFPPKIPWY